MVKIGVRLPTEGVQRPPETYAYSHLRNDRASFSLFLKKLQGVLTFPRELSPRSYDIYTECQKCKGPTSGEWFTVWLRNPPRDRAYLFLTTNRLVPPDAHESTTF